jgi:hypothetical protein
MASGLTRLHCIANFTVSVNKKQVLTFKDFYFHFLIKTKNAQDQLLIRSSKFNNLNSNKHAQNTTIENDLDTMLRFCTKLTRHVTAVPLSRGGRFD